MVFLKKSKLLESSDWLNFDMIFNHLGQLHHQVVKLFGDILKMMSKIQHYHNQQQKEEVQIVFYVRHSMQKEDLKISKFQASFPLSLKKKFDIFFSCLSLHIQGISSNRWREEGQQNITCKANSQCVDLVFTSSSSRSC